MFILPKANIFAPENRPSEKEAGSSSFAINFQVRLVLVSGRVITYFLRHELRVSWENDLIPPKNFPKNQP